MSEPVAENPAVVAQPGAEDTGAQDQAQAQANAPQPDPPENDSEETFPLKLVKSYTGDVHWNVAKGIWELVRHAETGEPNSVYQLVATIDGVDVPLSEFNSGGVETQVKSLKAAQSSSGS